MCFFCAKISNSTSPESALINIGMPKQPYIDHWACVIAGDMRNFNSISPESALINIGMPKQPYIDHWACVVAGDMRNFK